MFTRTRFGSFLKYMLFSDFLDLDIAFNKLEKSVITNSNIQISSDLLDSFIRLKAIKKENLFDKFSEIYDSFETEMLQLVE